MQTAILIGPPECLDRLERQLALVPEPPRSIGWVVPDGEASGRDVLGEISDLESIVRKHAPDVALISMPAVMTELITRTRTQLRRLGVPDRFMPTLEDQLEGVGPRTHLEIDVADLLDRPPRQVNELETRGVVQGRRVLITGAGGSIGSELARIVAGHDPDCLVMMDRSENALFEIDRQIARSFPKLDRKALLHDVVDAEGTLEHCRAHRPQVIFHAAAHKHVPMMEDHPAQAIDNNLFGTKAMVDAAEAVNAERFVMISTDKAVRPSSVMGATKRLAELYVQHVNQHSRVACSMVRFGNVLGSSGSVLDTWTQQIADGGPVTVTDPRMTRYFMTIPEAAALVIESAALIDAHSDQGEVFLLDMGEPIQIVDLACRFVALHGLEPLLPDGAAPASGSGRMPIVFTGARPGEKLHEELAFDVAAMCRTRHADINLWLIPPPENGFIKDMLCSLSEEGRGSDPDVLAESIRRWVPEMVTPVAVG